MPAARTQVGKEDPARRAHGPSDAGFEFAPIKEDTAVKRPPSREECRALSGSHGRGEFGGPADSGLRGARQSAEERAAETSPTGYGLSNVHETPLAPILSDRRLTAIPLVW